MDSIYSLLTELGSKHIHFINGKKRGGYTDLLRFDLKNKRIWNGDTVIMDKGKIVVDEIKTTEKNYVNLQQLPLMTDEERQQNIEELYREYKVSVPNKHSNYIKSNFYALNVDNMTDKQLRQGKPRDIARINLESYVMFSDLKYLFTNDKHFFWKNDDGLVLFRDWC